MPALPLVPNVLKASLEWSISSDTNARTGLFFEYSGTPPNNATAAALATTIGNAFGTFGLRWDVDTTLLACEVVDLSSSSGGVGIHTIGNAGTLSQPLSGASSLLVNYQLARRYRGGRPRSYLPWGDASVIGNRQTWSAGFVTACAGSLTTAFGTIIGATSGGTTINNHANVSYYNGFTLVTNPLTGRGRNVPKLRTTPLVDTIVGFTVSTRIANQRRRG